jgi:hypothetical protein
VVPPALPLAKSWRAFSARDGSMCLQYETPAPLVCHP